MLIYSVLFNDGDYFYVELYDQDNKENVKVPVGQFGEWRIGKIER